MKHLLVGILFGTLATIGLAAQTPIAMCPQSGALSVYMSMGAGGCSVGTLTFSNFSYQYSQLAGVTDTSRGTTTTIAPSKYNLSPYIGPNGTGLAVDAPLAASSSLDCYSGLPTADLAQCEAAEIQQQTFSLTFDVSSNNGTAINGLGINFRSFGIGGNGGVDVSIPGSAPLSVGCQSYADMGQTCSPDLPGCPECPANALHENLTPIPSANVTIAEQAYEDFDPGNVGPLAVTFDVTPEPATWLLFGTGLLLMLGLIARARRNERIAG